MDGWLVGWLVGGIEKLGGEDINEMHE